MKIERTKNATRNMIVGWMQSLYSMIWPFIMRTAMIYLLGIQYCGLNGLFSSILSVLNLAELGVGSAMVYSMYRPIAEDDDYRICALMRLYKIYYRVIGLVVGGIGLVLMPFVPNLIRGSVPSNINIYVLYLLNLGSTVLTYWLFAYKNCLLTAHQRSDISAKISMLSNTIRYVVQIAVLWIFHSYYLFLIVMLVTQIGNNILTASLVSKMYPRYHAKGKLEKSDVQSINRRVGDLFTAKIGAVVVNSADTVVISAFLGLTTLAIYQNYYALLAMVQSFSSIALGACTAGIGNSLIIESKSKNFSDLKRLLFLISWLAGWCSCCFLCLFQPFMRIWVGEYLLLDFPAVICFCVYFFLMEINRLLNLYKDAGGIWHEDRFRPLITAFANLGMNLIMVQFWGIYGILLSTVLSTMFIGMPWLLHNLFTVLFCADELRQFLKKLLTYTLVSVLAATTTCLICYFIRFSAWGTLITRMILCCVIPNLIFILAYKHTPEFAAAIDLIDSMTKGRLPVKKLFRKRLVSDGQN